MFLPKEHGSWSLVLEPLALSLLVVPSLAGGALTALVLAAFFARRPLKVSFEARHSERRMIARETLVMFGGLMLAGGFELVVLGDFSAALALLLPAPFAVLFAYFDGQGEGRAAAAEIAGSVAFAWLPATFALLAGATWPVALALAAVALARSVPAIMTVRTFLRQRKGQPAAAWVPLATALAAVGGLAWLAARGLVPALAVVAVALFFARTAWLVLARPSWSAKHVGMLEAGLGLVYVIAVAAAYARG